MILYFLVFLSAPLILKAQDTNNTDCSAPNLADNTQFCVSDETTDLDYTVAESPVFWVNMGFTIWGLLSFGLILSRFGDFCLLAYLKKNRTCLSIPLFSCVAYLVKSFSFVVF